MAYFVTSVFNHEKLQVKLLSFDTDSVYFASPSEDLDSIVPPAKRETYDRLKSSFFVLHPSQRRTPLLFKLEHSSQCFIGLRWEFISFLSIFTKKPFLFLSPKTYLAFDFTSVEEQQEIKKILQDIGYYQGPENIDDLKHLICSQDSSKRAAKGIPASTARKLSSIDFMKCLAYYKPKNVDFYSIARDRNTKEIVTMSQTRIGINSLSMKLRQTSVFSTEALF